MTYSPFPLFVGCFCISLHLFLFSSSARTRSIRLNRWSAAGRSCGGSVCTVLVRCASSLLRILLYPRDGNHDYHLVLLRPSSPFATVITFRCFYHRTAGSAKPKPNRRFSNWGGRGGANNQVWALSSKNRRCQLHHGTGRSSRWSVVVNPWHALHALHSLHSLCSLCSWHSWHSFCPQTRTRTSQLHIWQPNIPAVYLRLCQPEWLNSPCGSCWKLATHEHSCPSTRPPMLARACCQVATSAAM
jgi:hypothetical protein